MKHQKTIYDEIRSKGYSRRDFLKFCGTMTAMLGLEASAIGQVAKALETKSRLPLIWLHGQECTCCSESFIRSSHPIVADILLDQVSLDYTETLMAAAGHQAETSLQQTMEKYRGEYILLVEGSIPTNLFGALSHFGGQHDSCYLRSSGHHQYRHLLSKPCSGSPRSSLI